MTACGRPRRGEEGSNGGRPEGGTAAVVAAAAAAAAAAIPDTVRGQLIIGTAGGAHRRHGEVGSAGRALNGRHQPRGGLTARVTDAVGLTGGTVGSEVSHGHDISAAIADSETTRGEVKGDAVRHKPVFS